MRAVVAACRIGLDEEGSTVHKRPAFMGALASTLQPPRRSRLSESTTAMLHRAECRRSYPRTACRCA